jgi:hypothetical protein
MGWLDGVTTVDGGDAMAAVSKRWALRRFEHKTAGGRSAGPPVERLGGDFGC